MMTKAFNEQNMLPTIKQLKAQFIHVDLPIHWLKGWLLYVIDKPASFLISHDDYQLTSHEQAQWQAGIKKMQAGTPLAYLTGIQAFWCLDFLVNEHTLIPRPDTEILVEQVLAWIERHGEQIKTISTPKLLDMGTGSGCIAISLAYELNQRQRKNQHWQVFATDISSQALAVAQKNSLSNLKHNDLKTNDIRFIQSHWFNNLPKPTNPTDKFMIIVSNPPYIDANDHHLAQLTAEPLTALVADKHGLADIECIIGEAKNYLHVNGLLAIEHGYNQGRAVRALFDAHGYQNIQTVLDYGGQDRVALAEYKI